jgi:DNA-binding helix-hairpin-helix protein with protein kinase domain
VRLFGVKLQDAAIGGEIDAATLWRAIVAVPTPSTVAEIDVSGCKARPRTPEERRRRSARRLRKAGVIAVAIALLVALVTADRLGWGLASGCGFAIVAWPRANAALVAAAREAVGEAEREFNALTTEWRRTATEANFLAVRARLAKTRIELDALATERALRLAELTSSAKQQEAYLDRFRITRERVPGIGSGRASTLASFGIETADDISFAKIIAIPGFGPALAHKLEAWREDHLSRFRYDPALKPAAADVRAIEADILARRRALIVMLQSGPSALARANDEAAMARQRLAPAIEARFVAALDAKRMLADA